MINEILNKQKSQNDKSLEALKKDFTTLRTGKVNIHILDHIQVDYYGSLTPLNQVATVLASDASTISITPWEKPMLKIIESAIAAANIGVNPNNDGENVKLFFPPMTREQREENVKQAKAMGEKAKVSIRNHRKDANDSIKKLEKDKAISEDEAKKAYDEVQKITDSYTSKIDESVKNKETELLKV
ncbi:ribosome recycling factor [Campylobacter sp. LH-2024]|uniref:Ribosome recycling factor n=1 Tax=Campylobacter molothri TaxID=1032242 RepID=A0ACC5W2U5_9BACT|nr:MULTISPECIES: ribosome recycling factor [unclassified Campylobacter]MBZ7929005.1 ribosome recycling factor [Campylobacter sp. RM10542]MBZ7930395.1 ribosome recycling factor [Campylobacter sp. W0067]MBZ7933331.1 ribosome recycling factor [Campylobacter sp. RM10543]MBZ7937937.1 ribosome recycling factor [Campylobacter sp. RM10538]MBZ7941111.1 ribosome recycling factor [Campylobacter sp. W0047]MBZ7942640.1 ribosome recycling factor [Campylobacter sp. W0045]MBZ7945747.1 ribosome recycling fac